MRFCAVKLLIGLLFLAGTNSRAQTSFNDLTTKSAEELRAYTTLSLGYTTIAKRNAGVMGIDGMVFFWKNIALGGAAKGFTNQTAPDPNLGNQYYSSFYTIGGYTGIVAAWYYSLSENVSLSFPLLAGLGGIAYSGDYYYVNYYQNAIEASDSFVILEPGFEVNVTCSEFFNLAFRLDYRFSSPVNLVITKRETGESVRLGNPYAIEGLTIGLALKIGSF